jgi:uncharacterized protein involved in response to NO
VSGGGGYAPLHMLGMAFFGSMLIAMASRVSLGHSGRPLQADGWTWWFFWLLQGAALVRIVPDMLNTFFYDHWVLAAGLLWFVVFGGWMWKYAPMTWRPRIDGKSG